MAQSTAYKRTLSGSVGAGIGSIFNAGGKNYYILEHKVSSKYHHAGEAQEIIVDQIEIGRDPKCQVQFDESFSTVSRRHAAIVRDGENWKLVQLSHTNQTFLNGKPVTNEWYLQNGDEIQLSVNGPKLGFIIPQGNKSKTGSIALSRRLSLFRQQALKPYKTAMAAMAVVIVLLIAGGTWLGIDLNSKNKALIASQEITQSQLAEAQTQHEQQMAAAAEQQAKLEKELARVKKDLKAAMSALPASSASSDEVVPTVSSKATGNTSLDACAPNVYFVHIREIKITYNGQTKTIQNVGTGTGFLLDDGRFVTARHVVEPWMFPSGEDDTNNLICNAIAHSGGSVVCSIDAYSPTGKQLHFTSSQAHTNRSSDKRHAMEDGSTICLPERSDLDWAYFNTSERGGLAYNNTLSKQLPMRADLSILGYPMAIGANSPTDIHPIYSQAVVAKEGLEQGLILTTSTTFEHGNSGGPVFATTNSDELIVVGVVSAVAGRSTGIIVPISAVK